MHDDVELLREVMNGVRAPQDVCQRSVALVHVAMQRILQRFEHCQADDDLQPDGLARYQADGVFRQINGERHHPKAH